MRLLLAVVLFILGGLICTIDLTPAPRLAVKPYGPEEIIQEMKREAKQKQYDAAAKQAAPVFRRHQECNPLLGIIGEQAVEHHIPARILAAMAIAESSCNPQAVSPTGDYGAWQINAKIWKQRPSLLKDPAYNGRFAAHILGACIHKYGLIEGLHAYNGFDKPEGQYSGKVMMIAYGRAS